MFKKLKAKFIAKKEERTQKKNIKRIKKDILSCHRDLIISIINLLDNVEYWARNKKQVWLQNKVEVLTKNGIQCPKDILNDVLGQNLILNETFQLEDFAIVYRLVNNYLYNIVKKLAEIDDEIITSVCFFDQEAYEEFLGRCYVYAMQVSQFSSLIEQAKCYGIPTDVSE